MAITVNCMGVYNNDNLTTVHHDDAPSLRVTIKDHSDFAVVVLSPKSVELLINDLQDFIDKVQVTKD